MSIEQLEILYKAVSTEMPFYFFVEMVGEETNTQEVLSWFKGTVLH